MGMNVVLRIQCDGCVSDDATYIDLYEDSGDCYREGDLFEQARAVDGWYYADTCVYVCNDCLHLGPWLPLVDKEQIESGNISDDELVEVLDGYPDPDDEDFPDYFWIPENLDLSDEMIESITSKIKGWIAMPCLTTLSDVAAEHLSKHEGNLDLRGLTSLSDAAAVSLANKEYKLDRYCITLDNLPASAAKILRDAGHGE